MGLNKTSQKKTQRLWVAGENYTSNYTSLPIVPKHTVSSGSLQSIGLFEMESTHYVLSGAGKCTCNTPSTGNCQNLFIPVPSVTNTKTEFPPPPPAPPRSPDCAAKLIKILRYHLTSNFWPYLVAALLQMRDEDTNAFLHTA